jgi:hypothetical protein
VGVGGWVWVWVWVFGGQVCKEGLVGGRGKCLNRNSANRGG